jgi:hypothetical protein
MHFAAFPTGLRLQCIAAGCKPRGTVPSAFTVSGTTGLAAPQLSRRPPGLTARPAPHGWHPNRVAQSAGLEVAISTLPPVYPRVPGCTGTASRGLA